MVWEALDPAPRSRCFTSHTHSSHLQGKPSRKVQQCCSCAACTDLSVCAAARLVMLRLLLLVLPLVVVVVLLLVLPLLPRPLLLQQLLLLLPRW